MACVGEVLGGGADAAILQEPGRVNIERSVCFFGLHLLETIGTHNKGEGTTEEFLYWNNKCFYSSPEGTK